MSKGADELDYYYEPRCKICSATDLHGNPIRDKIDAYAMKHTYKDTLSWIEREFGIGVVYKNLVRHFKKHAPYVIQAKQYSSSTNKRLRSTIESKITESHEAIMRIVNIGDEMVKNWAEDNDGPKMPVSERLYVEALKEDGRRGTKTVIDAELEQMDKALFLNDGPKKAHS
jgi:hypothetical protein